MSHHDLAAHIRTKNPPRDLRCATPGRKLIAPRSADDARHRLWQAAEHLLRVQEVCRGALPPDGLPADAQRALARAVKALTDLKAALPTATKPHMAVRRKGGRELHRSDVPPLSPGTRSATHRMAGPNCRPS